MLRLELLPEGCAPRLAQQAAHVDRRDRRPGGEPARDRLGLDEALSRTTWAHQRTTTYHRNSKGRIVVPMPWTNTEYWHMSREPNFDDYQLTTRTLAGP